MQKENIKKITCLGDIHGRDIWKEIVDNEIDSSDKIVFIGDYMDTHHSISRDRQIKNLGEILQLKDKYPDKIVLLLGNHDYHYLPKMVAHGIHYSGFQGSAAHMISPVYDNAIREGKIQAVFVQDHIIYSHAGVTNTWCEDNHIDMENFEEHCNNRLLHDTTIFGFIRKKELNVQNWYGDDIFQSPLWVRPKSLHEDKVDNYKQVVGHTVQNDLNILDDIAFIDCLETTNKYLKVDNGRFKIKNLDHEKE